MSQYITPNTNTPNTTSTPPQPLPNVVSPPIQQPSSGNVISSPFFGSPPPPLIMTATPQQLQQQQQQQQQHPLTLEDKVDKLMSLNNELRSLMTNHQRQQQQQPSFNNQLEQQQQQSINTTIPQQLNSLDLINRIYEIKGEIQLVLRELQYEATQKLLLTAVPFIDPNSPSDAKDPLSVATYDSLQKQLTNDIITKQQQQWEEVLKEKDKLARNVERAKIGLSNKSVFNK